MPAVAAVLSFIDCINRGDVAALGVIWVAHVDRGLLALWKIVEDTPEHRQKFGLAAG